MVVVVVFLDGVGETCVVAACVGGWGWAVDRKEVTLDLAMFFGVGLVLLDGRWVGGCLQAVNYFAGCVNYSVAGANGNSG